MDDIFFALVDPIRRQLLERLLADNGQTLSVLNEGIAITRQGMAKHLKVLEETGLVVVKRAGREKLHFIRTAPLEELADGWLARFRARPNAMSPVEATGGRGNPSAPARHRKRKDTRRNHLSIRESRLRAKKRDDREAEERWRRQERDERWREQAGLD